MSYIDKQTNIYQRIYRFFRRNVEPDRIATTLDLPLKTVQNVLERFYQSQIKDEADAISSASEEPFLDVYVIPKVRYLVADISGWLTAEHEKKIRTELDNLAKSQWKVIALMMRDVIALDEFVTELLLAFYNQLIDRGRYTAILDPSPAIEAYIVEHKLEEQIPIFGTEKTFEDEAFSRHKASTRKSIRPH
jgi:anti-anti-sigma regulatory factor